MKKLLLLLALSITCISFAQDKEVEKDIRYLMKITRASEMGEQVMNNMINYYNQNITDIPSEFWKEFMKEMDFNELIDKVIPIYSKYYTHDEIKELIKFYESPIGKKSINIQGDLMNDCMQLGQVWGAEVAEKISLKLREKGYTD